MKKIFIFFIIFSINLYSLEKLNIGDLKVISSFQNMKEEKDERIDINYATQIEMLSRGVASSYVNKIIAYRDITGSFEKIEELKRIKGIGNGVTYTKVSKLFKIDKIPEKKALYINLADEEILKYYGFNKEDIKNIKKFKGKNGRIEDNLQLKKIISKNMYEKLKDKIRYEENKK